MEGIKEIQELLLGLKDVAVAVKQVMKDGKVDMGDIPILLGLLTKVSDLTNAVAGINQIPAEVKDLTGDEINTLVQQVLAAVAEVKAA